MFAVTFSISFVDSFSPVVQATIYCFLEQALTVELISKWLNINKF